MVTNLEIEFGVLEGRYFTEWRIDDLTELAVMLSRRCGAKSLHIWYEPKQDYHRLQCKVGETMVDVHYYKVFRVTVDGFVRRYPRCDLHTIPSAINDMLPC